MNKWEIESKIASNFDGMLTQGQQEVLDYIEQLQQKVNQLELDVDSYKTKYERANELYLDTSKKLNQLETNRDEAIEYIENNKVTIMGAYGIPIGKAYNLKEILERGKE